MSYATEWGPVAAIWGFVVILFVPYLGPLVVAAVLLAIAVALVRVAVSVAVAVATAPYRLGRSAHRTWQAWAAARQPSPPRADARAVRPVAST